MTDFTIITPSFNQGQHISAFFDSYRQAKECYPSIQLILVDNCSTDSTPIHIHNNIDLIDHLIVEPDDGQSSAINKALPYVAGRYINWINTDDTIHSDSLSTIAALFASNTHPDVVIGRCLKVYLDKKHQSVSRFTTLGLPELLPLSLFFGQFIQPSTFWRTTTFMNYIPLDESLHYIMDHSLFLNYLLENGDHHIVYTDKVLASALLHDECKSEKNSNLFSLEYSKLYSQLANNLKSGKINLHSTYNYESILDLFAQSSKLIRLSMLFRRSNSFGFPIPRVEFLQSLLIPQQLYYYLSVVRPTLHRLNSL